MLADIPHGHSARGTVGPRGEEGLRQSTPTPEHTHGFLTRRTGLHTRCAPQASDSSLF